MKKALYQLILTLLFVGALQSQKTLAQDLTIDPGTITFEEGSYMGGDVIRRFRLRVTNIEVPTAVIKTVTSYRVEVHLSRDGAFNDVSNSQDDFALHVFSGGPIGPGQSQEFSWNQLVPYNVEGQLFVVAKIFTVIGPADTNLENNSYKPTQGARLNLIPTKGFDAGLISKTTAGVAPTGFSDSPSLSSDARYVAFTSTARDLSFSNGVKTTDYSDVYIQDRITNTTRRVSISSSGTQANGNSYRPSISPDGNLVVFHSDASNLVANDTNLVSDVFIHDKRTGQTLRVSAPDAEMLLVNSGNTQSNGPSYNATISTSPAGIFVVYESLADNLTRRSVTGAIVPDTNRSQDIFLYDLSTSKTTRVNINDSGVQASNGNPRLNADSYGAKISRDGKTIVFRSEATNLVLGDTNGLSDVFVFNRSVNGAISLDQPSNTSLKRINLRIDPITGFGVQATRDLLLGGSFPDRGSSYFPDLSSNGRYIVYASEASNLSGAPAAISVEYGLPGTVSVQVTGFPRMKRINVGSGVVENATATPVITVSDGIGVTSTFEFVDNQAAGQSNIEIAVKSTDTDVNIAASLATAINLKISSITAVAVGNTVTITHSRAGYTPSISSELDAKLTPATVVRSADLNLNVGDRITVNDGTTSQTFEAIQFGSVVTPGNIPFAVGVDGETTRDLLIGAINQAGLNVVARVDSSFFNGGQAISIVSKQIGPAPAGFAVSVNSLLSFSPSQQKATAGTNFVNNGAANVYLTDRDFDGNGIYDEVGLIGGIAGMKSVLISRSPTGEFGVGYYPESARNYYRPDSLEPTISADGRFVAFRSLAVNLLPSSVLRSDSIEVANSYLRSTDIAANSIIAEFSDYNETEDVYVHDRDPGLSGNPQVFDTADITKSFFRNTVNTRVSVNKFGFQTSGLIGLPNIPASRQPQISPDGRFVVFVSDADNNGGIAFDQTNLQPLDSNQKRDVFFLDRRFTQDPAVDLGFPVSTILSPVLGNTFSIGSSVVITASATDTNRNGSITSVEFFVNGASIGFYEPGISNPSAGRYSLTWNVPNSTGLLNLYTKVTDNEGNVSSSPVVQVSALVALGQIPVFSPSRVSLSRNPIPLGSSATLSVVVTDNDGQISGVDFLANGQIIGTVTSAPYSLVWSPAVTGIYDIRAIARDNDGNSRSTAEAVLATVANNIAPNVTLTEPTSDVSVRIGASVSLTANASDPDGSIAKAEFFANGVSIAVVNNPGLTVTTQWTPTAPGDYSISVVVTDDLGVKSTNLESLTVRVQPIVGSAPAVQISAPALSSNVSSAVASVSVGSQVLFVANATDNTTVTSVKFYADGILLGAAIQQGTSNQWALSRNLNGQPFNQKGVGVYLVTALAVDSDGNQTQSASISLTVTPNVGGSSPTGSLVFPSIGSVYTLGQVVPLQALANDQDGAVASVDFYANGILLSTDSSAPFTGTWTPTVAGSYNLTLVITDSQGTSTVTSPVAVVVNQSSAPSVNLATPVAATTIVVGSNLPLVATASDLDGTIVSVGFYVDGALVANGQQLGNSTTYTATWTPTLARSGAYKLSVKATDNVGLVTETSTAINVTVNAATGTAPTVQVTAPSAIGTTQPIAALGSQLLFAANATDNISVTAVSFYADGILIGAAAQQGTSNRWTLTKSLTGVPFSLKGVGSYSITALATDADGNQTLSEVQALTVNAVVPGSAPTGSLVYPTAGSVHTLGQVLNLQASAVDNEGAVASVGFYANGEFIASDTSAPFSVEWKPTVAGNYNITLLILDSKGATTVTSPVPVTIKNSVGQLPQVTALAPTLTLNTAGIYEFEAVATDADGTSLDVSFVLNNEIIGAGVYSSTTRSWLSPKVNFSTRGAGSYSLTAIVVDSDANQVTSSPVVFTVSPSIVDSAFGVKLNEVFLSLIGRNSSDREMQDYFNRFGVAVLDYEIAAALVQTSIFESSGAVVINAYRAVFGEYPTFSAYQDGLNALNSGVGKAAYINSLYLSSEYIAKFGPLPSFASNAAIEKFAGDTHFNLTGVKPSTQRSNKMTASDWGLSVAELDSVLRNRRSELSVIAARFSGLTSGSVGSVVAAYIDTPVVSDKLLQSLKIRARVAGVILSITEPDTAISLRETDELSTYNLLDVAELYGTGSTDAAIKPIFRVLPSATSVVLGAELKLSAIVISSAGVTTNDISGRWTYNRNTTLGAGTAITSTWPVHEFTYTIPAASLSNAGTYDFSVTNRNGTAVAPRISVTVSPVSPVSLPLINELRVGVPFSIDLGDDLAGMTYVAKSLPAGLSLNSSTGVISGTPRKAGSAVVTYYTVVGKVSSPVKRTTFVVSR